MSKDIPVNEYMKVASEAWTHIHLWLDNYINWLEESFSEYEPHTKEYISHWIDFLIKEKVAPISTEEYIATNRYQWTIDLVAWIDWEQWVLDWKTWWIAQEILGTKWPKWKYKKPYAKLKKATVQLSLYAYAKWIKNIWVVELEVDGYHFHPLELVPDDELDLILKEYEEYTNWQSRN